MVGNDKHCQTPTVAIFTDLRRGGHNSLKILFIPHEQTCTVRQHISEPDHTLRRLDRDNKK